MVADSFFEVDTNAGVFAGFGEGFEETLVGFFGREPLVLREELVGFGEERRALVVGAEEAVKGLLEAGEAGVLCEGGFEALEVGAEGGEVADLGLFEDLGPEVGDGLKEVGGLLDGSELDLRLGGVRRGGAGELFKEGTRVFGLSQGGLEGGRLEGFAFFEVDLCAFDGFLEPAIDLGLVEGFGVGATEDGKERSEGGFGGGKIAAFKGFFCIEPEGLSAREVFGPGSDLGEAVFEAFGGRRRLVGGKKERGGFLEGGLSGSEACGLEGIQGFGDVGLCAKEGFGSRDEGGGSGFRGEGGTEGDLIPRPSRGGTKAFDVVAEEHREGKDALGIGRKGLFEFDLG